MLFRLSYSFGLKTTNTFMHSDPYSGPGKTYPNSDENRQSLYPPFSDQKGAQTIPFGAAHTLPIRQRGKRSLDSNKLNCNGVGRLCSVDDSAYSTSATYTVNIY